MKVTEHQRRALAASLTILDDAVQQAAEYAMGREVHSVMSVEVNRLSQAQCSALLGLIELLRARMRQMKEDLGLPTLVQDVTAKLRGQAASAWAVAADLTGDSLRSYGEVDPQLAAYVDGARGQLVELLLEVASVLDAPSEVSNA